MDVSFDDDVNAADAVEFPFFVFVLAPVAFAAHVSAAGFEFFVACEWYVSQFSCIRRKRPYTFGNDDVLI